MPDSEKERADEPESPETALHSDAAAEDSEAEERKILWVTHEGEPMRLDAVLSMQLDYSRAYLQRLIESGYVDIVPGQKTLKPATKIPGGKRIKVVIPPPLKVRLEPQPIPLDILYQDEHLAVIDKPANIAVHPAPDQSGPSLVNALLYWLKDLSGIAGLGPAQAAADFRYRKSRSGWV